MDDAGARLIPQIIFIVLLTGINAFFASAEMAMVSCNRNRIAELAEDGNKSAIALLKVTEDQTRFLSTIQIGITLAGFFSSASAATSISQVFATFLAGLRIPHAQTIAMVVVTLFLSYITLVLGELVPKRIALTNADGVALGAAKVIGIISKLTYPFVKLLSFSTTIVLKLMGKYSEDVEERISEEELKGYIRVSQQQGVINSAGEEMIVNIMDFDDTVAYEIMTPRTALYMIDYEEFTVNTIDEILEKGFSRMPVYRENTDNIIGMMYIKDLFVNYSAHHYQSIDLDEIMKEPYFVPETKKIDLLFKEMQTTKNSTAILIDEYGGVSGMVTMEDLVEEIVGEIEDEYDTEECKMEKIGEGHYILDGSMDLDDINDQLETDLFSEEHETISGLMIELLGYIPSADAEGIELKYSERISLKELSMTDNRIEKIEMKLQEISEEQSEE